TPKILDILKEENVQATFFIVGKNAETRKNLLRREIEEGHVVAVHSYSHVYRDIYSSPEKLLADIDKCNEVIKSATGRPSLLYRFPGGSYGLSSALVNAVTERGLRYVDWNASTRDAELINPSADDIFQAAVTTPANKERIVLLAHDSTTKTATASALKDIIRYYKDLNYTFSTF
ncbi:MAG: polysaccharide deacetylase, partial [Clostridia bacterium]|nr:polysaccharide deacetylase [Clostridia bacterium]